MNYTKSRLVVYKGLFYHREDNGLFTTFNRLTGIFKGISNTTENGREICNIHFWEPEENRMTILRIYKTNALSLLMPMSSWSGTDDRMTLRTRPNNGEWTAFDISTRRESLQWPDIEIPQPGTFRELFIESMIEGINKKLTILNEA